MHLFFLSWVFSISSLAGDLTKAIVEDDPIAARSAIREKKENPNGAPHDHLPPLHFCATTKTGSPQVAAVLLDENANPFLPDRLGCTPLMMAVKYNKLSLAEVLLKALPPEKLYDSDHQSQTAMSYAMQTMNVQMIQLLQKYGFGPEHIVHEANVRNRFDLSDISASLSSESNLQEIEDRSLGDDLHSLLRPVRVLSDGEVGSQECAHAPSQAPEKRTSDRSHRRGRTVLMRACQQADEDAIKSLMGTKHIHMKDRDGVSAFGYALGRNGKRTKIQSQDMTQSPALRQAIKEKQMRAAQILLENQFDPKIALTDAVRYASKEGIRLCLKHHVPKSFCLYEIIRFHQHRSTIQDLVRIVDPENFPNTLLEVASELGDVVLVQAALNSGADPLKGLLNAMKHGHQNIVDLLNQVLPGELREEGDPR